MSADPNKKSARSFQCRDVLWETFEQMARELECSVDYLINEAMKQYARQRSYGGTRTPYPAPARPDIPPSGDRASGPPPFPAPPPPGARPPTGGGLPAPPGGRLPPPPGRPAPLPAPPPRGQMHGAPTGRPAPMPAPSRSAPPPPPQPRMAPPPLPRGATPVPGGGANGFPSAAVQTSTLSLV